MRFNMRHLLIAGLLATPASAESILGQVKSDLDGDGRAETFLLLDPGNGSADLRIENAVQGTILARNIAWVGGSAGQIPELALADNGSLQLISMNEAIGRGRWRLTLTIAYRQGAYRVAGFTYLWRDTIDLSDNGICDANLLTGKGEVARNSAPKHGFKAPIAALPVTEWLSDQVPVPPDECL